MMLPPLRRRAGSFAEIEEKSAKLSRSVQVVVCEPSLSYVEQYK